MVKNANVDWDGGWQDGPKAHDGAHVVRVRCKGLYFGDPVWFSVRLEHCFCEVELEGGYFLTLDIRRTDGPRLPSGAWQTCEPRIRWGKFTRNFYVRNDKNWAYTRYNFDGYVAYRLTVVHVFQAFRMSDDEWACQTRWRSRLYDLTWFNCHTYAENMCCLLYAMTRDGEVLSGATPRWLYNHPLSPRGCWRAFCPGLLAKRRG
ncbi:hypothetical protein HXX76_005742 [Chlamydomonas incerta]|uniref:Uncharacterized protein n=1 Tax=Chlamydomonas incerta TaxID=51695 RepID=A0A835W5K0_CHLIN|nr:hypothetical protein HXX76_005742 [Chlamydomonas incerta]|eukprot:KAG2438133.1 hypothetical protein HXX76_005742 [Chlamydomonas incerta]